MKILDSIGARDTLCGHAVQFYEGDDFLYEAVADFVEDGVHAGQPVIVIATPEHRAGFSDRLSRAGIDLDTARRSGALSMVDADATLRGFMRGNMPDADLFTRKIGGILDKANGGRELPVLRAYGEMVDILWREGNCEGALRLEELWNELAHSHRFQLLCAYAIGNFHKETHVSHFEQICAQHTHVIPGESYMRLRDESERLHEITQLQQRALMLESEIERRRVVEAQLIQAKAEAEHASAVKSDFLAVMSHELRTPLNAIVGYEDLLTQGIGGPVTSSQQLYLGRIRDGANQLIRLVDQVLSLSRIEAGMERVDIEKVDVTRLVTETAEMMSPSAAKKGLGLAVTIPDSEIVCDTDAGKLRQILLNLMSNALKFTTDGFVELSVRTTDGCMIFDVRDSGSGIEPTQINRIFEPFVQIDGTSRRQHGGTGLGLAVSRDLTKLIGGNLTVTSKVGMGSTFTLSIPLILHGAIPTIAAPVAD